MVKANKKRVQIVEMAVYRLSHFGMAKTTMSDIAGDLSFSKALLYYYFPDKNSLFAEVLEHVIQDFCIEISQYLAGVTDPHEAMMYILEKRVAFIIKYYKLLEYTISLVHDIPAEVEKVILKAQGEEMKIVSGILERGNRKGILKVEDIQETARMMLYAIVGMRFSVLNRTKNRIFPAKDEFDEILALQQKLVTILLNGLGK